MTQDLLRRVKPVGAVVHQDIHHDEIDAPVDQIDVHRERGGDGIRHLVAVGIFYRQFKKQSGLTPAGYRRKYSVRNLQEEQNV